MNVPRRQHVVSKFVLSRFCDPSIDQLTCYALAWGKSELKAPRAVGFRYDFVKVDAQRIEDLWNEVETAARPVLDKIEAVEPISAPEAETIKDLLAVHWARSERVYRQRADIWHQAKTDAIARAWAQPERLAQHFYMTKGLYIAGPQGRDIALRDLFEGVEERMGLDNHNALRTVEFYGRASAKFQTYPLELVRPAPGTEFLIGDSPCLGLKNGEWCALDDLDTLWMPLAPGLAASLSTVEQVIELTTEQTYALNAMQVRLTFEHVLYRPGAFTHADIEAMRGSVAA